MGYRACVTKLGTTLAENVRRLREARGLSLNQLAERSGVAKATLSKVERENTNPTLDTITAIGEALGVDPISLLRSEQPRGVEVVRANEGLDISDSASIGRVIKSTLVGSVFIEIHHQIFRSGHSETSMSHGQGAREHVFVRSGSMQVGPMEQPAVISAGDYANYAADEPHRWVVQGKRDAEVWIVHTIPHPAGHGVT